MNRRKQKLLKRYLEEMLMRLQKYREDPECARFLEYELRAYDLTSTAFINLYETVLKLTEYLER